MAYRMTSLRTRVLALGVIFSVLIVGTVFVTTYLVVAQGMSGVASGASERIAAHASKMLSLRAIAAQRDARAEGLGAGSARTKALRRATAEVSAALREQGVDEAEFVVYDRGKRPVWSSSSVALRASRPFEDGRLFAIDNQRPSESRTNESIPLSGLYQKADFGWFVAHVPSKVLGAEVVLDVVYEPRREESILDGIRIPMTLLAATATLFAIAMVEISMTWVLRLVDDLRAAADAVDAEQLDVSLPEYGNHEIGELARSLNGLLQRLRRRADAQTRFVADASHELATPVAGIRGYIGILRAWGADDPEVREEAITAIDRESKRMVRLCGELLSVIRSEDVGDVQAVRCDVNALCREALASTATRYLGKALDFSGPEEGPLIIHSDPDRIDQVLSILLDNAAKYTPIGGRVAVATYPRSDGVLIEVSDSGIGIPEKDLPNIFDRFYRSDDSRCQETGGFGLGLSIAPRVVQALGGTIDVRSKVGEGTTFAITLPRARPDAGA